MWRLREKLREMDEELYAALEASWAKAERDWLPAMPTREGSFNSSPHLRNVEQFVEQILFSGKDSEEPFNSLHLNAIEIYLLLAAVLFHDIGRVTAKKGEDHESASAEKIKELSSGMLIPCQEVADSLAVICEHHGTIQDFPIVFGEWRFFERDEEVCELRKDILAKGLLSTTPFRHKDLVCSTHQYDSLDKIWDSRTFDSRCDEFQQNFDTSRSEALANISIHPYGNVRQLLLATLLLFADRLDGTSRRVLAKYLGTEERFGGIAKFRSMIPGVSVCHDARMIFTEIGILPEEDEAKDASPSNDVDRSCLMTYAGTGKFNDN